MYKTHRTVEKCRIHKVGDNMTTSKTSKISLNLFDDKGYYENVIRSYPHDENPYLFKRVIINKIKKTSIDLDKDQLANNILELTINDERNLIETSIRLYNDL